MEVMEEVEVMEAVVDVAETGIVVIRSFCSNAFYLAYDPSSSRKYKDVIMANSQGSGKLPISTDNEDQPGIFVSTTAHAAEPSADPCSFS